MKSKLINLLENMEVIDRLPDVALNALSEARLYFNDEWYSYNRCELLGDDTFYPYREKIDSPHDLVRLLFTCAINGHPDSLKSLIDGIRNLSVNKKAMLTNLPDELLEKFREARLYCFVMAYQCIEFYNEHYKDKDKDYVFRMDKLFSKIPDTQQSKISKLVESISVSKCKKELQKLRDYFLSEVEKDDWVSLIKI